MPGIWVADMGVSLNSLCINCLLGKHIAKARSLGSEETALAFTKAAMQLMLDADPETNSTILGKQINDLYMTFYHLPQDQYQEEKEFSNRFVMERLPRIARQVASAADPILAGLQYAIMGNYIDFSALGKSVSFDTLDDMLTRPESFPIDHAAYQAFLQDLQRAKNLLYITDNAGEIGFDMVLAQQLSKAFPHVKITFCVRGGPAHNDATRADAQFIGLPFPVIDSGCDIGGMPLALIGSQAKDAMEQADIILSKGMGNVECLYGCGMNIYYAFLIKCPRLAQVFDKPHMSSMFVRERA